MVTFVFLCVCLVFLVSLAVVAAVVAYKANEEAVQWIALNVAIFSALGAGFLGEHCWKAAQELDRAQAVKE